MQFFLIKLDKKNKKIFLHIKDLRLKQVLFCFILICFFPPKDSFCQASLPLEGIIQNVQGAYEKTRDFKADFVQETFMKSVQKKLVEKGAMFFKKPRNILWDYSTPEVKKIVLNSRKAWLYLPKERVAYLQSSSKILQSQVLMNFFSGAGKINKDFIVRFAQPEATDSEGNYLLVLTPRQKNAGFNEARIAVDKNHFSILRFSFDDAMGNTTTLYFSNMVVNANLPQKIFEFQPPADVEVFPLN
ncbi:MAG TPA: outer membrane lipoprotein carrier protein LolA [Smithella sp.]|nr:outer membrane lipoprotein carrier protein LolA [Smithella sp.]HRS97586.1 outer membrane lipoprotein carrier protein LolA [Smithella sp.]